MVAQMSLAVLAAVDLVAVQVDIVCQTHVGFSAGRQGALLPWEAVLACRLMSRIVR
jgi:hypothetical protein